MMNRLSMTLLSAVLAGAMLLVGGCNDKGGAVAVVDLEAVAKALGRDQAMTQQLQNAAAQINQQVTKKGQDLQLDLKAHADKLGAKPSDEDKKQFAALQTKYEQEFAGWRQAGGNKLREVQVQLAEQFRNEVKPFAERFARERGANMVMVSSGLVLWMDSQIDITGDVISAMRSAAPAPTAAKPAPAPGSATTTAPKQP